jgi:RNA polymerase sigma-70 factor (ECF subfamily)
MKDTEKMATILTGSGVKSQSTSMNDRQKDDAFEIAFNQHWEWVCCVLYRLTGDWDEAEDLALHVFTQLQKTPPQDAGKLRSWLRRVATNTGLNALRARQRRQHYEIASGQLNLIQTSVRDPAAEVEQREIRQQVRQVLADMNPRMARVLVCRMMGLSYAEIATVLKVAPGSVGTMLARAEKVFERRYRTLESSGGEE